jgi:5-formyltetrahydrofolate cyclo-ligase
MEDWKTIQTWRKAERARLIERRMATPLAERRAWSAAIEQSLAQLLAERGPRTIGFYWPFKAEFDPRSIVRRLVEGGSQAALPVVLAPKTAMEFRLWQPDAAMAIGVYDIPYPAERNVVVPDLVLAPLVGFDAAKYRLGYGGGYFDRTLAVLQPRPFAIGIGFQFTRLATVHPQPHDLAMDAIVTEAGVFA